MIWTKALSVLKKAIQSEFDYSKIRFTEEYYDVLGLEPPERILKTERDYEEFETIEIRTGREDSGQWISIKKNTQLLLEF